MSKLEKYYKNWISTPFLDIETSKETMLGAALAFGKSCDSKSTWLEAIFVIPHLGVKFMIPRFMYKSKPVFNIKIAGDLKHTFHGKNIYMDLPEVFKNF